MQDNEKFPAEDDTQSGSYPSSSASEPSPNLSDADKDEAKARSATDEEQLNACPVTDAEKSNSCSVEEGEQSNCHRGAGEASPHKLSFWARCKERLKVWKNALVQALGERSAEVKHAKAKRIAVGVGLALIVLFFLVFYFTVGWKIAQFVKDPEEFKAWLKSFDEGNQVGSILIFIFLRIVQTVLKLIPGEALEIAAGCAFGTWEGLLWCSVGSFIGSLIIVLLGKKYGMRLVGLFVSPEKMQSIAFLRNKKRLNITFFLLYFIPGTPKDMFTWLVCLTDENVFMFLLITAVARIPSIVTSTWCGQELVNQNYWLSAGILGGTILLGIIGGLIYKFVLNRRKKMQETEE